jgi:hypothetical protein
MNFDRFPSWPWKWRLGRLAWSPKKEHWPVAPPEWLYERRGRWTRVLFYLYWRTNEAPAASGQISSNPDGTTSTRQLGDAIVHFLSCWPEEIPPGGAELTLKLKAGDVHLKRLLDEGKPITVRIVHQDEMPVPLTVATKPTLPQESLNYSNAPPAIIEGDKFGADCLME